MCKYRSIASSFANTKNINKPNEDYYLCDDKNGIYILVDGVSRDKINGIYPNPSPALEVSKLFVNEAYDYIVRYQNLYDRNEYLLQKAMINGNSAIKAYNECYMWENDFFPGTVGIIVFLKEGKLYYSYIGDCYGILIGKQKRIFTKCQTKEIARHKKEYSSIEIRNDICNNVKHPCAYGVLNGDVRAKDFMISGVINTKAYDEVILCSDGFSDVVTQFSGLEMKEMSIEEMNEAGNLQDDKTIIQIKVKNE